MIRAYVLVQTEPAEIVSLRDRLDAIPEVVTVDGIAGPYDAVVVVSAHGPGELHEALERIALVPGVRRTVACFPTSAAELPLFTVNGTHTPHRAGRVVGPAGRGYRSDRRARAAR